MQGIAESEAHGEVISKTVYAYSLMNPPKTGRGSNITIRLEGPKMLAIRDCSADGHTRFKLDMHVMGGIYQEALQSAGSDTHLSDLLILSCNLVLRRAVLTKEKGDSSYPDRKTTGRKGAMRLLFRAYANIKLYEVLDEARMAGILSRMLLLDSMDDGHDGRGIMAGNLKKALLEYERGMSSRDVVGIFRSLYMALEFAARAYGHDANPNELVSTVSGTDAFTAKEWYDMYIRFRHHDRDYAEQEEYLDGLRDVREAIPAIRWAAQKAIIGMLRAAVPDA